MLKDHSQRERSHWLQIKARGKHSFKKREMFQTVVLGVVILVVVGLLAKPRLTASEILVTSLIMLPIFLLGGYLSAGWKWNDLEKKYPG